MTRPAKLEAAFHGLNGMARKVYDAIPLSEPWTIMQITGELHRTGGRYGADVVRACLTTIVDAGLAKETREGFRRVDYTQPLRLATTQPNPEEAMPEAPAPKRDDPLTAIAQHAQDLRNQARHLVAIADALDGVALDVTATIERSSADSRQLQQLRALLAGLNH